MLIALLAVLPISVSNAQTSHRPALTVKVPFEFVVGNQTFPAGIYKVESLLNSIPGKDTINILVVSSIEGRRYQAVVTGVADADALQANPRLVFTRSGDRYFLSEVWELGKRSGCWLQNSEDQTESAEQEREKVTLVASLH